MTDLVVYLLTNSPVIKKVGKLNERQFDKLIQERKRLIPVWMEAIPRASFCD